MNRRKTQKKNYRKIKKNNTRKLSLSKRRKTKKKIKMKGGSDPQDKIRELYENLNILYHDNIRNKYEKLTGILKTEEDIEKFIGAIKDKKLNEKDIDDLLDKDFDDVDGLINLVNNDDAKETDNADNDNNNSNDTNEAFPKKTKVIELKIKDEDNSNQIKTKIVNFIKKLRQIYKNDSSIAYNLKRIQQSLDSSEQILSFTNPKYENLEPPETDSTSAIITNILKPMIEETRDTNFKSNLTDLSKGIEKYNEKVKAEETNTEVKKTPEAEKKKENTIKKIKDNIKNIKALICDPGVFKQEIRNTDETPKAQRPLDKVYRHSDRIEIIKARETFINPKKKFLREFKKFPGLIKDYLIYDNNSQDLKYYSGQTTVELTNDTIFSDLNKKGSRGIKLIPASDINNMLKQIKTSDDGDAVYFEETNLTNFDECDDALTPDDDNEIFKYYINFIIKILSVKNYDWEAKRLDSKGLHKRWGYKVLSTGTAPKRFFEYVTGPGGGTRKRPYTNRTRKKNNKRKKTKRKKRKY
jgi:hypothetical protein